LVIQASSHLLYLMWQHYTAYKDNCISRKGIRDTKHHWW